MVSVLVGIVLVSFGNGFSIVLVCFWYGVGMGLTLVSDCLVYCVIVFVCFWNSFGIWYGVRMVLVLRWHGFDMVSILF